LKYWQLLEKGIFTGEELLEMVNVVDREMKRGKENQMELNRVEVENG
jgi:hypothetical protein